MKELNHEEKKFWIVFLFIGYISVILVYFSALHSIDLSYNAKGIPNLIDDNGIIQQTPENMYQNGYRYLWIFPLITSLFILSYMRIIYKKVY